MEGLLRVVLAAPDHTSLAQLSSSLFEVALEPNTYSQLSVNDKEFAVFGAVLGNSRGLPKPVDLLVVKADSEHEILGSEEFLKSVSYVIHKVLVTSAELSAETSTLAKSYGFRTIVPSVSSFSLDLFVKLDEDLQTAIKQVFDKFDRDLSGFIDFDEFKQAYSELGEVASEEELKKAFKELDENSDEHVSLQEFVNWWKGGRIGRNNIWKRAVSYQSKLIPAFAAIQEDLKVLLEADDLSSAFNEAHISFNIGEVAEAGFSLTLKLSTTAELEVQKLAKDIGTTVTSQDTIFLLRFEAQEGRAEYVKNKLAAIVTRLASLASVSSSDLAVFFEQVEFEYSCSENHVQVKAVLNPEMSEAQEVKEFFSQLTFLYETKTQQYVLASLKSTQSLDASVILDNRKLFEGISFNLRAKFLHKIVEAIVTSIDFKSDSESQLESEILAYLLNQLYFDVSLHSFNEFLEGLGEAGQNFLGFNQQAATLKRSTSESIEDSVLPSTLLFKAIRLINASSLVATLSVCGLSLTLHLKAPGLQDFLEAIN
mmetsp:Transcript_1154/g.2783  ORF Transcript_1154/g.2783 Transcript_1154/m.2783 type:complete len:539 (-) Transcript_1154:700-2316(-)